MSTDFVSATESVIPFPASPSELMQQTSPPPAGPTRASESAYDRAWATFQAAFDAAIAEQAQQFRTLRELAKALPDIADEEVARVRAEGERRVEAERDARREILADFDVRCEALRQGMASLAAELASAARRVDALARQVQAALASETPVSAAVTVKEPVAESPSDLAGRASPTDEARTDPWALVEAAMRLFNVRTPADESVGRDAGPGTPSNRM